MMNRLRFTPVLVLLAGLLATPAGASAQVQDANTVVDSYVTALNAHDIDALLALYAEGAQLSSVDAGADAPVVLTASSPDQLRAFFQGLVGDNIQLASGGRFTDGASVTWQYAATLDEYRRLGIAPLAGQATMLVQGGKIQAAQFALTPGSVLMLATARTRGGGSAAASGPPPSAQPVCTGWGVSPACPGGILDPHRERSGAP